MLKTSLVSVILIVLIACLCRGNSKTISVSKNVVNSVPFPVSIVHVNDLHARFDDINNQTHHCHPGPIDHCFGGYARMVTTVKRLLRDRENAIFLNAGDNFQGTFWYIVGRWNMTAQLLNMLPADVMTIGNHEFSHQVEGLVPFLNLTKSTIVVANMDASDEPSMQNLFQKSVIIDRYDRKIGVIGVILSTVDKIARTGKLHFHDEIETIQREAELLSQQGVDIIIVLSHCGLNIDYILAENAGPHVDVIVGGHTHTFMYTGSNPPGPLPVQDEYPAVVRQPSGRRVLIVQASAFAQHVGDLVVYFDGEGEVIEWKGNPVFLDESVPKDEEVEAQLIPWRNRVEEEGHRVIGQTQVSMERSPCFRVECRLGNMVADAAVRAYVLEADPVAGTWTSAAIAMVHVGLMRVPINEGDITIGDVMTLLPYENTLDYMELTGTAIVEVLEQAVSRSWSDIEFVGPDRLQFSGLRVVYNTSAPIDHRVESVEVLCHRCVIQVYEPLQLDQSYPVIVPSFLIDGGNGFDQFQHHMKNHRVGPLDIETLIDYLERFSPLITGIYGRIRFVQ